MMIGVGMPAWLKLLQFGEFIHQAFGSVPHLVGSALEGKVWRDVDVRLILSDEEFDQRGFGDPERRDSNARLCATTLAWSEFGRVYTGLPIDFQIQQRTWANNHEQKSRSALLALWDFE